MIHRRVQSRVTRGGALFILALTLTGAGAFLSGNNLLFLIFASMMALLLVSGFISRLVLSGLELELLLPEHVSARTTTVAKVRIRNLKPFSPSFSIELAGQGLTNPVYFPMVSGLATIETAVEVVFPHRGLHKENLFSISTKFPFDFLRKSTRVALRRDMIVYPALAPQPGMDTLLDSIAGELETYVRGDGRDFYRIRPYEPQDSARHVDWKSTAHAGGLQVREFTRDEQGVVEIFFDRRVEPGQQQRFEELVENCAFVVWSLAERDSRVWFRSQRFALELPEEGEVYDLLRFLALVEPMVIDDDQPAEYAFDEATLHVVFSVKRDTPSAGDPESSGP
jgi:uncharacterized protein (DUF58 family)